MVMGASCAPPSDAQEGLPCHSQQEPGLAAGGRWPSLVPSHWGLGRPPEHTLLRDTVAGAPSGQGSGTLFPSGCTSEPEFMISGASEVTHTAEPRYQHLHSQHCLC